jgi:hypothetical protein
VEFLENEILEICYFTDKQAHSQVEIISKYKELIQDELKQNHEALGRE